MYNLIYKGWDGMKKTKDVITAQLSNAQKESYFTAVEKTGATHFYISTPLDVQSVMTGNGTTPSPRTMSGEIQDWCDRAHAHGLKVGHRGTLCGAEAVWGASYYDGSVSTGTAASSSTDGNTTLCGKWYNYLYTNVGLTHVEDGDSFNPIPEGTTHAFDGHHFWTAGSQANYADVYAKFHTILNTFASAAGKTLTFMSHNNYSEVRSGWIPSSMFSDEGIAPTDYYGQYQGTLYNRVADYVTDMTAIYNAKSVPAFHSEFGFIAGNALPNFSTMEERMHYEIQFYKNYRDSLVDTNKMTGANAWAGWEGQNTSMMYVDGSSEYQLNAEGKILAAFYKNQGGMKRVPVIRAGTTTHNYTF